jgi:glycosyltransferase involved in cell wall biosynthesis
MSRNKIAIITSSPSTVFVFLQNHIKYLSSEFDVYVISNIHGENEQANLKIVIDQNVYKQVEKNAVFIHVAIVRRISIFHDIKTIISLFKIFRGHEFSSVHSITSKVGILVMISAFLSGINNRFHTYTGQVWANMTGIKRFFFKLLDKIIGVLCTSCFADSKSQMYFLVQEKVVSKKKISVLGEGSISGVDLNRFHPDKNIRNKMREKLSIHDDEIVFLLLCRLTKDKGVIDLAKAFSQIVKELNCTLLIVGPDEENIKGEIKLIIGFEYSQKLIFQGFTECHERFLNTSDILCLPSYREGFGTVIIDAAATGIPSIGSDIYGIRDAIDDGSTGILHKPGDIASIYTSMHRLATDKLLREQMGEAALKRVRNSFTMEEISKAWLTEYNEKVGIKR